MAEYKFSCPQCGQHIQCSVEFIGAQINCPSCQKPIIIPSKTLGSTPTLSIPVPEKGNSSIRRKTLICIGVFGLIYGLVIVAGAYFLTGVHQSVHPATPAVQKKPKVNGDSANLGDWVKGPTPPAWVKLVRAGNKFTGYYSTNGSTWTLLCAANVAMSNSVFAGLAVTAHNNESLNHAKFDNVTIDSTPISLNDVDVGAVGMVGNANLNDGIYTVSGGGADIFGKDDQFNFDYQSLIGDATLIARVVSEDGQERYSKCGVMFRETLATNSPNVRVVISPANGVCMEARLHR